MLFQGKAVFHVVAMVSMESTVFPLGSLLWSGLELLGPFQRRVVPYVHKDLLEGWVEGSVGSGTLGWYLNFPRLYSSVRHDSCPRFSLCYFRLFVSSPLHLLSGSTPWSLQTAMVSSTFMCFWARSISSAMLLGGDLERENRNLVGSNTPMKAVSIIFSSTSSTCNTSWLNLET